MTNKFDDTWTVDQLKDQPEYEQVEGRSQMSKEDLIAAMNGVDSGASGDTGDGDDDDEGDGEDTVVEVEEQPYEENYLGVAPEYRNSATDATAPIDVDSEEDDVIVERVREMTENLASEGDEPKSFEDWVGENPTAGDRHGARGSNPVTRADKS